MIYEIFNSATDSVGSIGTSYVSATAAITKVWVVRPGPISLACVLAGPTSLEVEFSFAYGTSPNDKPAGSDDTLWHSLCNISGTAITTVPSFTPGTKIMDLSGKGLVNDGTMQWLGRVPPGVNWIRTRIKRTGSAVTSLVLKMLVDGPNVSTITG